MIHNLRGRSWIAVVLGYITMSKQVVQCHKFICKFMNRRFTHQSLLNWLRVERKNYSCWLKCEQASYIQLVNSQQSTVSIQQSTVNLEVQNKYRNTAKWLSKKLDCISWVKCEQVSYSQLDSSQQSTWKYRKSTEIQPSGRGKSYIAAFE